jgi:hypothetical protein
MVYPPGMASWAKRISLGAVLVGLCSSAGCQGEPERFPPPQPYSGSTSGAQGGGGGDAAGGSGAGGATGGTTTTGPVAEANLCECAHGIIDGTACGECVNDAYAPMQTCEIVHSTCLANMACKDLLDCGKTCSVLPEADKIACIQGCYAQVDVTSPINHDFVSVMNCFCDACAIECAPSTAIACE